MITLSVSTLLGQVLEKCGAADKDFIGDWKFRAAEGIPIAAAVLFPMSLIKDMSGFRYISFASIGALFYTGIVLICEMPAYINQNKDTAHITPFVFDWNFFTGACITFFAYTCQVQLLPIYSELINPVERRIKKIVSTSIAVDLAFYLTIAAAGYFSTFDKTERIVLNREPLNGQSRDYAIIIA